jgi:hypothetical protein
MNRTRVFALIGSGLLLLTLAGCNGFVGLTQTITLPEEKYIFSEEGQPLLFNLPVGWFPGDSFVFQDQPDWLSVQEGVATWIGCDSVDGDPFSRVGSKCAIGIQNDRTVTVSPGALLSLSTPTANRKRISFSNAMPQVSGGHLRGFPDCDDVTVRCFMFTRARAARVYFSFSEAGMEGCSSLMQT